MESLTAADIVFITGTHDFNKSVSIDLLLQLDQRFSVDVVYEVDAACADSLGSWILTCFQRLSRGNAREVNYFGQVFDALRVSFKRPVGFSVCFAKIYYILFSWSGEGQHEPAADKQPRGVGTGYCF